MPGVGEGEDSSTAVICLIRARSGGMSMLVTRTIGARSTIDPRLPL